MVRCDRRAYGIAFLMMTAAGALALAQQPPATDRPPDSNSNKTIVTVRGCVDGALLTHTQPQGPSTSLPKTLKTTGSRAMRTLLKELNGHLVDATGVIKGVQGQATGSIVRGNDKTKVYVGVTERRTDNDVALDKKIENQRGPTLEVSELMDLGQTCFGNK
jgi:hypothetical protein